MICSGMHRVHLGIPGSLTGGTCQSEVSSDSCIHRSYYCEGLTGAKTLGNPWATCLKIDPNCGTEGDPCTLAWYPDPRDFSNAAAFALMQNLQSHVHYSCGNVPFVTGMCMQWVGLAARARTPKRPTARPTTSTAKCGAGWLLPSTTRTASRSGHAGTWASPLATTHMPLLRIVP